MFVALMIQTKRETKVVTALMLLSANKVTRQTEEGITLYAPELKTVLVLCTECISRIWRSFILLQGAYHFPTIEISILSAEECIIIHRQMAIANPGIER